jgi:hypothetical protein
VPCQFPLAFDFGGRLYPADCAGDIEMIASYRRLFESSYAHQRQDKPRIALRLLRDVVAVGVFLNHPQTAHNTLSLFKMKLIVFGSHLSPSNFPYS